jgi:regulatory protein YycI of two-component signal transduction system YycFG
MSDKTKFIILICLLILSIVLVIILNTNYNQALLG